MDSPQGLPSSAIKNDQFLDSKPLPKIPGPPASQIRHNLMTDPLFRLSGFSSLGSCRSSNVPSLGDSDSWSVQESIASRNSSCFDFERGYPPLEDCQGAAEPILLLEPYQCIDPTLLSLDANKGEHFGNAAGLRSKQALFGEVVTIPQLKRPEFSNVARNPELDRNAHQEKFQTGKNSVSSGNERQLPTMMMPYNAFTRPLDSVNGAVPPLDPLMETPSDNHLGGSDLYDRSVGKRRRTIEFNSNFSPRPMDLLGLDRRFASIKSNGGSWNLEELQLALDRTNEFRDWLNQEIAILRQTEIDEASRTRILAEIESRWNTPCRPYSTKPCSGPRPLKCVYGCNASWSKENKYEWLRHLRGGRQPRTLLLCGQCNDVFRRTDKFRAHQTHTHGLNGDAALLEAKTIDVVNFCKMIGKHLPIQYTTCLFCNFTSDSLDTLYGDHIYDHFVNYFKPVNPFKSENNFNHQQDPEDPQEEPPHERRTSKLHQSNQTNNQSTNNKSGSVTHRSRPNSNNANAPSCERTINIESTSLHEAQDVDAIRESSHNTLTSAKSCSQSDKSHLSDMRLYPKRSVSLPTSKSPKPIPHYHVNSRSEDTLQSQQPTKSALKQPEKQEINMQKDPDSLEMLVFSLHVQNITYDEQILLTPDPSDNESPRIQCNINLEKQSPAHVDQKQCEQSISYQFARFSNSVQEQNTVELSQVQAVKPTGSQRTVLQSYFSRLSLTKNLSKRHPHVSPIDTSPNNIKSQSSTDQHNPPTDGELRQNKEWCDEKNTRNEDISIWEKNRSILSSASLEPKVVPGGVDSAYVEKFVYS